MLLALTLQVSTDYLLDLTDNPRLRPRRRTSGAGTESPGPRTSGRARILQKEGHMKTWSKTLWVGRITVSLGATPVVYELPRAQACGIQPFLGEICTFAFNLCPLGFLPADGRLLAVSLNTALFSLLGTTYGGNGVTTFGLPDLRG